MFTSYKENKVPNTWKQLGSGIDATAYLTDDGTVMLYTDKYHKVKFSFHLGIVVNYHGYYLKPWKRRVYVVELVYLENYPDYHDAIRISNELGDKSYKLSHQIRDNGLKSVDLDKYPEFAPALTFLRKQRYLEKQWLHFDTHTGNFRRCPVTGKLIPIDLINFTYR